MGRYPQAFLQNCFTEGCEGYLWGVCGWDFFSPRSFWFMISPFSQNSWGMLQTLQPGSSYRWSVLSTKRDSEIGMKQGGRLEETFFRRPEMENNMWTLYITKVFTFIYIYTSMCETFQNHGLRCPWYFVSYYSIARKTRCISMNW